jgi:CubicO group peptidase (beta-lactamase class C family)
MRRPSRRALLAGVAAVLVPLPALAQTAAKEKVTAALPKLEEFARLVIDKKLVPGLSIAIVHRDEVVFLGAFGVRQVGKPEPVDADTVFQLASLSKPLASTVVSALVSDGKVSWDSRIRDIDPGFVLQDDLAAAAVTIGDLFANAADCRVMSATTLRSLASPKARSCTDCVRQSRPTASATATRTAISA